MKLALIIEKNDNDLWGRIENAGDFLPVTTAESVPGVIDNIKDLVADYLEHEGNEDPFWKNVKAEDLEFDLHYDLQALFTAFDFLNISKVASRAGLNPALLRHYASGTKHPSGKQAKKIEDIFHQLAQEMNKVSVYAD